MTLFERVRNGESLVQLAVCGKPSGFKKRIGRATQSGYNDEGSLGNSFSDDPAGAVNGGGILDGSPAKLHHNHDCRITTRGTKGEHKKHMKSFYNSLLLVLLAFPFCASCGYCPRFPRLAAGGRAAEAPLVSMAFFIAAIVLVARNSTIFLAAV